ncbi:hypothetical protein BX616_007589 [Lobosporangium transversale]|nr:hypothetical protein BX616_007589 [Lobosporangium transversale]
MDPAHLLMQVPSRKDQGHKDTKAYSACTNEKCAMVPIKPNTAQFEKDNNLSFRYISNLLNKRTILKSLPEGLLDSRYNVRGSIREFYPVELLLKELVLAARRMRLPMDYSLLRFMANGIYTILSLHKGGLKFPRSKFSNSWIASFTKA